MDGAISICHLKFLQEHNKGGGGGGRGGERGAE